MNSSRRHPYLMIVTIGALLFSLQAQAKNLKCKQNFIEGRFNCIKSNSKESGQKSCIGDQTLLLMECRLKKSKLKPGADIATLNRELRKIQIEQEDGIRACLPDNIESLSDRDKSLVRPPRSEEERDQLASVYEACMLKNQALYQEKRIELGRNFLVISDDTIKLEVDVAVQTPFGVTSAMVTLYGEENKKQKETCSQKNKLISKTCNLQRKQTTSQKRKSALVQLQEDYNIALDMVCAAASHFTDKAAGRTWYDTIKENYLGWCEDFETTIRGRPDGEWPRSNYGSPKLTSCKRYKKQNRPLEKHRCLCDFDCGT